MKPLKAPASNGGRMNTRTTNNRTPILERPIYPTADELNFIRMIWAKRESTRAFDNYRNIVMNGGRQFDSTVDPGAVRRLLEQLSTKYPETDAPSVAGQSSEPQVMLHA